MADSRFDPHRSLATVAMLQTNYDANGDHLDMFMPFVLDTISSMPRDDMAVEEVRDTICRVHGLAMPNHVLGTLLRRATKKGHLTRAGGRYHRTGRATLDTTIQEARAHINRQHAAVASGLRKFANSTGEKIDSDEEALDLIVRFLDEHHITFIVSDEPSAYPEQANILSRKQTIAVAGFLREVTSKDPTLREYIRGILEGIVLQKTLLLSDINPGHRDLGKLTVFIDTGMVLRAIGMCGDAARVTVRDTLETLRASSATLCVFESTLEEVERILAVYEKKLETPAGYISLIPTEVTRHVKMRRLQSSDIAIVRSTLRINIAALGLFVRSMPKRRPSYTADEVDLANRFKRDENADVNEPRIWHDVDVVAAILVLRAGHAAHSLEETRAVFATSTRLVVLKVLEWWKAQHMAGVPPVVSDVALANTAWLRRPALAAPDMKLHQLVALCAAALQPSRKTWKAFVEQLRKLQASGAVTSDEAVLAIVSAFTEERLIRCDEESEVDAETVLDVIDRVREGFAAESEQQRKEFAEESERQRKAFAEESERQRKEYERLLAVEQSRAALLADRLSRQTAQSSKEREEQQAASAAREERMRRRVWRVSSAVSWMLFAVTLLIVVVSLVFSVVEVFQITTSWKLMISGCVLITGLLGIVDLFLGKHVNHLRERFRDWLERKILAWLVG